MSGGRRGRGSGGVTLIELILTVTILAVAGAIVAEAFGTALGSWRRGFEQGREELAARIVSARLSEQLRSAVQTEARREGNDAVAFEAGRVAPALRDDPLLARPGSGRRLLPDRRRRGAPGARLSGALLARQGLLQGPPRPARGDLIARALDQRGRRFVVVENDETRAQEVDLMDFHQVPLARAADARLPAVLETAGLRKEQCRGVLALTNDDRANLAVAMTVRLLEPNVPVLARVMTREVAANMASFGTDHIINPFARFGEQLALAISAPANYRLVSWLTALPGTRLAPEAAPTARIVGGLRLWSLRP